MKRVAQCFGKNDGEKRPEENLSVHSWASYLSREHISRGKRQREPDWRKMLLKTIIRFEELSSTVSLQDLFNTLEETNRSRVEVESSQVNSVERQKKSSHSGLNLPIYYLQLQLLNRSREREKESWLKALVNVKVVYFNYPRRERETIYLAKKK